MVQLSHPYLTTGKTIGEGNGNSLQYSSLGNPMDIGAWRATFHGVAKESILKEINPEYSLEGLMLKLKLQYFGHVNS